MEQLCPVCREPLKDPAPRSHYACAVMHDLAQKEAVITKDWMPVPRCDQCKHWDNVGFTNKSHGACRLSEHNPFSLASFGNVATHADFGCVGWEAK